MDEFNFTVFSYGIDDCGMMVERFGIIVISILPFKNNTFKLKNISRLQAFFLPVVFFSEIHEPVP
jgi:hypothetical protein